MKICEIDLDDNEQEIVRFLAERLEEGNATVLKTQLPRYEELGRKRVSVICQRFARFGWVDTGMGGAVTILAPVIDVARRIQNPRPRDYWTEVVTWFRGRWWSVPLLAILIGLPLLVQYVEMFLFILRWLRVLD